MQTKTIKPATFLFFRTETTVEQLSGFISTGQSLYEEAVKRKVRILGAIQWHYHHFSGLHLPFTLEVCLPVEQIPGDYDGPFHVKRTEPFRCVSAFHDGDWLEMPKTYEKIITYIHHHGLKPAGSNREVYINVDFNEVEANMTEIQMGVC